MKTLNIGICNNGTFNSDEIMITNLIAPKVPRKLHSCVFKLCARISQPFVEPGCRSGLEIHLLNMMKEAMDFDLSTSCSNKERGEIINGSWSDLLADIRADTCDIIVGAFFPDYEVHEDFGITFPYYHNQYTW